jgi:single-strand DNA-binding protein
VGDRPANHHLNLAVVGGCLSSDPVVRPLPSGDPLTYYEVRVTRPHLPTDTVPVVLVGGAAPDGLVAGDEVLVVGRVRRRFFRAAGATESRTEIVADRVVPARRRAALRRAMAEAAEALVGRDVSG